MWEHVAPLIRSCADGYNACIFAYGQTGSGEEPPPFRLLTHVILKASRCSTLRWHASRRYLVYR